MQCLQQNYGSYAVRSNGVGQCKKHQRLRVCLACQGLGCSPKDCTMYRCSTGHDCGHLAFEPQLLYDVGRGHSSTLTCRQCMLVQVHCDACGENKVANAFDPHVVANKKHHSRTAVCCGCQHCGFSPKDGTKYECCKGHSRGHKAFAFQDLNNWKRRGQPLLCLLCKKRVADLLTTLRHKDVWRCTCRHNPGVGKRAYAAVHGQWHEPRCRLTPTRAGEERWDGKNMTPPITKEDLQFLAEGRNQQGKSSY